MFYVICYGFGILILLFSERLKRLLAPIYAVLDRIVVGIKESIRRKEFVKEIEKVSTYQEKKEAVEKILFDHPADLSKKDYLIFFENLNECEALSDLHRKILSRIEDFKDVSKDERNLILEKYRHLNQSDHDELVNFVYDRIKVSK